MKKITVLLGIMAIAVLILIGCERNAMPLEPVTTSDNVPGHYSEYPTITIVDTYNNTYTYEYAQIWFENGLLNVAFPECSGGGCGVSTPIESVVTFYTSQVVK